MTTRMQFEPKRLLVEHDPQANPLRPWVAAVWHWLDYQGIRVPVHCGFRCDFDSVPGWLRWLINPAGPQLRAAMFHDAMYRYQPFSRATSDSIFWDIMREDRTNRFLAWLMYAAVRMFGGKPWRENAAQLIQSRNKLYERADADGVTVTRYH